MSSWPRFVRGSFVSGCAADMLVVGDERQWSPIDSLIITDRQIVCMWPWWTRDNRYRSSPKLRSRVFFARVLAREGTWIAADRKSDRSSGAGCDLKYPQVSPIMPVRYAMWNCWRREIAEVCRRCIDSTIDIIRTRKEWRCSPVAAAVPAVAAVGRPLNRKTPSLPGNGASRIGCEKASPADSLGSEYR